MVFRGSGVYRPASGYGIVAHLRLLGVLVTHFALLDRFLRTHWGEDLPDTIVHPNDEMLQQWGEADERDEDHARVYYYRSGLASLRALEQIVRWRFGGWARVGNVLDFASGYGRLTRLLLKVLPKESIAITEINTEAVAFQAERYGVASYATTTDPKQFQPSERYDAIFAGSLFSHLPESTTRGWIRRLGELLTPRGVLAFSVHNLETIGHDIGPEETFVFFGDVASRFVNPADYGNCWMSDAFLGRVLREEVGPCSFVRIHRGLANFQDLCIVVREEGENFGGLHFDVEPDGHLDRAMLDADGRLSLQGWSFTRSPGMRIEKVEALLGDKVVASSSADGSRPDVGQFYGDHFSNCGWELRAELSSAEALQQPLQIQAVSSGGTRRLLWIGTPLSALVRTAWDELGGRERARVLAQLDVRAAVEGQEALTREIAELRDTLDQARRDIAVIRHERDEARARIQAMELSRFWKLRRKWFRVKRALRLTTET